MKPDKCISGRVIEGNYLCLLLDNGKTSFTKEEHDQYIENVDDKIEGKYWVFDGYCLSELVDDYPYLIKEVKRESYEILLKDEDIEKTAEICEYYFRIGIPIEICEVFDKSFNEQKEKSNITSESKTKALTKTKTENNISK